MKRLNAEQCLLASWHGSVTLFVTPVQSGVLIVLQAEYVPCLDSTDVGHILKFIPYRPNLPHIGDLWMLWLCAVYLALPDIWWFYIGKPPVVAGKW